ncbi:MAG: peptidase S51, partial [Clostridia bacterium]|nr:peptidase S51 [Clostridia bacterium]
MSVNVLLNYYNFDGDWAKPFLEPFVQGKKVLILPLAFRENQAWDEQSFQQIYGVNGEKYQDIIRPFLAYGIAESDIQWLDFFDQNTDPVSQINNADLLFFTGGMPEKAILRMHQLGIVEAVKNFQGVVMGASAGAMLQ